MTHNSCSTRKKSKCRRPCRWVKGKGCHSRGRRASCTKRSKSYCIKSRHCAWKGGPCRRKKSRSKSRRQSSRSGKIRGRRHKSKKQHIGKKCKVTSATGAAKYKFKKYGKGVTARCFTLKQIRKFTKGHRRQSEMDPYY